MKKVAAILVIPVFAAGLAACGGSSDSSSNDAVPAPSEQQQVESPTEQGAAEGTTALGQKTKYGDLMVGVSKPVKYKPTSSATTQKPGWIVNVSIQNDGSSSFDTDSIYTNAAAGDAECEEIYDTDLSGSPDTKTLPGRSKTWKVGFACPSNKSGEELVFEVQSNSIDGEATFVGKTP